MVGRLSRRGAHLFPRRSNRVPDVAGECPARLAQRRHERFCPLGQLLRRTALGIGLWNESRSEHSAAERDQAHPHRAALRRFGHRARRLLQALAGVV